MELDREKLEQDIAETTRSLQRNIALLEDKTMKTVEDVTQGVRQTAQKIQDGVQELSISHQMEKRPGAIMAAAVGLGTVVGMRMFRRPKVLGAMAPSLGRTVISAAVSQAAQSLLPIALGLATEWAADKLANRRKAARQ